MSEILKPTALNCFYNIPHWKISHFVDCAVRKKNHVTFPSVLPRLSKGKFPSSLSASKLTPLFITLHHLTMLSTLYNKYSTGLFSLLDYSHFWSILTSGLFSLLVYSHFWSILTSGLFSLLVYSHFWTILTSGLYSLLDYTHFWSVLTSTLLFLSQVLRSYSYLSITHPIWQGV